jgi:hypothetical protein
LWLQSQHHIDRPEIAPACRRSAIPPCRPLLLRHCSFEQVVSQICFWDPLP